MQQITKDVITLCGEISMPPDATSRVLSELENGLAKKNDYAKLCLPHEAETAWLTLRAAQGEDEHGFKMLALYLCAAAKTRLDIYKKRGLPSSVFVDTMKVFTRFVHEHMAAFGCFGFDRAFWVWRHTSGLLFRIGTLEFEVINIDLSEKIIGEAGTKTAAVSVHIPSDADLKGDAVELSYKMAKDLFSGFFADSNFKLAYCESWLLAPGLKELLHETSGILGFAKDYEIKKQNLEDTTAIMWVFKTKGKDISAYPENTSLQRSLKKYLLSGKKLGAAFGVLKSCILF